MEEHADSGDHGRGGAPVGPQALSRRQGRNPAELVFGYAGRGSVKDPWNRAIERAKIERLTPHSCRHGFATTLLRMGKDVKTVAKLGGWKDAATVLRTYAHALDDPTLTDVLFGTNPAHGDNRQSVTIRKARRKAQ